MKTITDITITTTTDNFFAVDFTLGGYEGNCELTSPSAVRVFVEDTIDLDVDRDVRAIISERVCDLILDDVALVCVDVLSFDDPSRPTPFECDLHWMRHGITYNETLTF